MSDMFRDIPFLLGEIRGQLSPTSTPSDGMPGASGTNKSAPISLSAVDDSDDLYATLVEHAESVASAMDMKAPPLPCLRRDRGPMGFPAHTGPDAAVQMGKNACRFIEYHLDYLSTDLADEIFTDLQGRYARLTARYQTKAEAEQMPCRCPECSCLSVYKKPPKEFGDPEVYHCRTCMKVLTEAQSLKQCELREAELKSRRGRKRGSVGLATTSS